MPIMMPRDMYEAMYGSPEEQRALAERQHEQEMQAQYQQEVGEYRQDPLPIDDVRESLASGESKMSLADDFSFW